MSKAIVGSDLFVIAPKNHLRLKQPKNTFPMDYSYFAAFDKHFSVYSNSKSRVFDDFFLSRFLKLCVRFQRKFYLAIADGRLHLILDTKMVKPCEQAVVVYKNTDDVIGEHFDSGLGTIDENRDQASLELEALSLKSAKGSVFWWEEISTGQPTFGIYDTEGVQLRALLLKELSDAFRPY